MKRLLNIEYLILAVLWISSISTYSYALLNNYNLYNSDYLGLLGLIILTIYAFIKPNKIADPLLILMSLGLFNLVSFIYFYNVVFTFGFSNIVSPGIQLYSLILLTILIIIKRERVYKIYQIFFGQTEKEMEQISQLQKESFMKSFKELTDKEINSRLQEKLVPEAREALTELSKERETHATKETHTP